MLDKDYHKDCEEYTNRQLLFILESVRCQLKNAKTELKGY